MIKKNDNVIIIAGKDRGKTGVVYGVLTKKNSLIISGLNLIKKHQRPRKAGEKGQIIDKAMPIHISNVMLVDSDSKKPTRVGYKMVGDRHVRVSKRSGKEI